MSENDPVQDGIYRINDFLVNMGMQPMKAAEIEPLLMKFTPKEAIRGIKKKPAQTQMPMGIPGMMQQGGMMGGAR